jgi:hypothetical protein
MYSRNEVHNNMYIIGALHLKPSSYDCSSTNIVGALHLEPYLSNCLI